jgi:Disulphide bond corrector protein DsbC.
MKGLLSTLIAAGLMATTIQAVLPAQLIPDGQQNRSAAKNDAVQYLFPEQVTVAAGKSTPVALHFRIAQGMHINSHTPADEFLIPTVFSMPANEGVKLDGATYPSGALITLPSDPKTKLSVYTGEFIIQAKIVSQPGDHLVQAKLHYQACNDSQCLPPRTITVPIDVIGK